MSHQKTPRGYFIDPDTGERISSPIVKVAHLPGEPLSGICRYLFWWVRVPQYQLLHEVIYVTGYGKEIRVPMGFIFNGGTIPWFLWWLYPPDKPECLGAFAVHDYLCTTPYQTTSEEAHAILYDACRAWGCPEFRARVIYNSVLCFGPCFDCERSKG